MRRAGSAVLGVLALVLLLASLTPGAAVSTSSQADAAVEADFHTLETPKLPAGEFELMTLSTLPDAVTGGDVLVAVRGLPPNVPLRVTRNGADVSAAFARAENGERRGLVTGLAAGDNALEATALGRSAVLTVRNHPITGPVISGPHQSPFICRTEDAGLGKPLDKNCSIATTYQWFYRSTEDQEFHELEDPYAEYPSDVMQTETMDGSAVPFVVRVESSSINRGITRIAVLDDPHARGPAKPFDPATWDRRVYYVFGESCGVGYHQGVNSPQYVLGTIPLTDISADTLFATVAGIADRLSRGDITVHSTLSTFGVHCNSMVSMETAMMIKEYITERYGPIDAVIGTNGSGAALQQYNAANNAPGLLDAALPTASFADVVTTAMTVTDCGLLQNYYANSELDWNDLKKSAVNGHNLQSGNQANAICQSWTDAFLSRIRASDGCDGVIPDEMRYDPKTNPKGVRCTVQDATVNIWGRDPATGFARRPLDNIGIQYGLGALNDGIISFEEFADLNRRIGGYDIDGNMVPQRHRMDPETEAIAYRIGAVIGRGALAETPVIDLGVYLDLIPVANIHESVRPFIVRARLRAHSGQDESQSIWRGMATQPDVYAVMDEWLSGIPTSGVALGANRTQAIAAAKTASAEDRCVVATAGGRLELPDVLRGPLGLFQLPLMPGGPTPDLDVPLRIDVPEDFDSGLGPCSVLIPPVRTPRIVAGMPMTDDIIKCRLKPIDAADYPAGLSDQELAQLKAIFPEGVCDYSVPAAHDVKKSLIWPSIGAETLETPHELKWRVARSTASTTVLPKVVQPLPATGISRLRWPALGFLAVAAGLGVSLLRARSRRP